MLKQFLQIRGSVYHTYPEFQTFGFGELVTPPEVLPDKIHYETAGNEDPNLCMASAVAINGSRLLCCGPVNSRLRMHELNALLHYIIQGAPKNPSVKTPPVRFSIFQFAFPEKELEAIRLQRYLLSKYPYETDGLSLPHLNFPFDLFFHLKSNKPLPLSLSTTSNKLSRLHNIEGWLTYSRWIFEEINVVINSIALTDTAKYSLEASLMDFSHELRSIFLNDSWHQLETLTLKVGNLEFSSLETFEKPSYQKLLDEEKQAFELRIELHTYLQIQMNILDGIGSVFEKMHPLQPEQESLKAIVQVFKELLVIQTDLTGAPKISFGKQLMLASLLNSLLGVTTVLTSEKDIERTCMCFSISLAIMQLLKTESMADVVKLALEWDTTILAVNLWTNAQEHEAFTEWLKNLPTESDGSYQPNRLTTKLRLYVYKNLETFTAPLLKEVALEGAKNKDFHEMGVSNEYLNFLPSRYIEYNEKTGQPIAVKAEDMGTIGTLFGA